jgi:hypothetical protein
MTSAKQMPPFTIAGELTEEEQEQVRSYQSKADQLIYQLGAKVVEMLTLYNHYHQNDVDAMAHGKSILNRLGLPETTTARIHENKVLVYGNPSASGDSPPSEE